MRTDSLTLALLSVLTCQEKPGFSPTWSAIWMFAYPHSFLCCGAGVVASDLAKEKTRCGTWQYWLVVGSVIPVVLIITLVVRKYLVRQYEERVAADYEWTEGEIEWTPQNTLVYPLICSLAGALRSAPSAPQSERSRVRNMARPLIR